MTQKEHLVAVNLPADGLFLAIEQKAEDDFSRENCTRLIRAFIQRFLDTKPDVIFLNVNYRRALTPSQVMDSYLYNIDTDENGRTVKTLSPTTEGVSKYFTTFFTCARPLLQKGIDIYEILTRQIREAGCKVYLSVRMNDGHYRDNPAINTPFSMKHSCNGDGADLDYSQEVVQNRYYAYIEELLGTYKVDGIELDWLRYPSVLPKEKRGDHTIISDYMRRIRALLDGFDPDLGLAVRLYPHEEKNLGYGFDPVQWLCDGTADLLTIENFYVPTNFEMPVKAWRESIAKRNTEKRPYTLLCGSDWGVCCQAGQHIPMNPSLVRGFAADCLSQGADGIYLFNFFEENDDSSWELTEEGKLKNCFSQRLFAARDPYGLPRRHIHIGATTNRYPILLAPGERYCFTYERGGKGRVILGCDGDVFKLQVNGKTVSLSEETVFPGYEYPAKTKSDFVYAVTQLAPVVKTAPVTGERIEITVENNTTEPANILWLELSFS